MSGPESPQNSAGDPWARLSPAVRAALDEALAAQSAGDVRGMDLAWARLVETSGRRPERFRWVVG